MPTPTGKFEFTAKDKTKGTFKAVSRSLKSVTGAVFNMKTALAAVAGGAGFGLLIASSLKSIDLLGKTADKIGITTEGLAKMQLAASITGVSSNTLNKSLQKMIVNIADVSQGTGEASDAFNILGISAKDLINLNPEQQFAEISEAINKLENNTQRVSAAYDIFGGRGTALLNTLKLGKEGIEAIGREAELFGLTMSRDTVLGVEKANDAITRLGSLGKGFANQMTAALAPAIEDVVTALKEFVLQTSKSKGGITGFAQSFAIDLLEGFKAGVQGIKTFLEFVDSAKEKLIEWGIINVQSANQEIIGQQNIILGVKQSLKTFDRRFASQETWIELNKELLTAQAKLQELMVDEPGILDKVTNAFDRLIVKQKERLALTLAGGADVTPPKKPSGGANTAKNLGITDEEKETKLETVKAFLASQTEAIAASLLTEDDMLLASHERRSLMVEEAALRDVITSERKNEIIKKLDEKLAKDQARIQKQKDKAEKAIQISGVKFASGIAKSLVSLVGSGSKKKFEIGKKFAKASVVMDTAAGIMKVIAQGGFVGAVAAIGVAIAGIAQLANINRTQFGGGGGISSGGVSFPSPTAGNPPSGIAPNTPLPDALPGSAINITILGNFIGNEEFVNESLVPILRNEINDNDTVLFNNTSQQALELAS